MAEVERQGCSLLGHPRRSKEVVRMGLSHGGSTGSRPTQRGLVLLRCPVPAYRLL